MAGRYFGSRQAVLKRGAFVISTVDVYFKYNTLLLHGTGTNAANNNTIVDSNATPKTITRNGNVKPGSISPFSLNGGWSNYFNGSTDYLTMPAPTGSIAGDFTLEGWYYFNAVPGTSTSGYAALDQSSSGGIGIMFFTTTVDLYASFGSTYGSFSYTWAARTWYHVAIVRSGTTVTCYVNGIALTPATGVSVTWTAGGTVYMGKNAGASQQYFNGYISNFRLIKGTAVYTAAFTPPTAPLTAITNTSLLTCQSNRFVDTSSSPATITVNGTPTVQAFNPFGRTTAYSTSTETGSLYFDGSGDYLTAPNSTDFSFGTGDFTVEFWMYVNTAWTSNNGPGIGQKAGDGTDGWVIYRNTSINTTVMSIRITQDLDYATTVTPTPYSWQHWAVVRSGTTLTWYCNGVACGVSTGVNQNITDTSGTMNIGRAQTWSSDFNGYLSNVRVVKGTAVYTGTFTPSTTPLTAISGTSLLLKGTDAGIYDSTGLNNIETVADARINTAQSKYGGSAIYFDGSGDYMRVLPNNGFSFGTGDFTIECWAYVLADATGGKIIVDSRPADTNGNYWSLYMTNTGAGFSGANYTVSVTDTLSTTPLNTWMHLAVTRQSGTLKLFVNGVSVSTASASSSVMDSSGLFIGTNPFSAGTVSQFNGYISDLRITKGVARYTTTFTPPTAILPDTA